MAKKILIGLGVVLAALVLLVAMQPSEFRITRSTVIEAPPARVFAELNDFHRWEAWSPWAKLDPNMKTTYEGPASGVGSSYAWIGNKDVGEGKMTIQESSPSRVLVLLEFMKPMAATNHAEFTLTPQGKGTKLEWAMTGKNAFIGKAFCLVMNMDKMVGPDFEKGLAQLKAIAEAPAKKK